MNDSATVTSYIVQRARELACVNVFPIGAITKGSLGDELAAIGSMREAGIDPREWQGFAFGMGVERVTMLKHGISDLRLFYESDIRWLRHYGFNPLAPVALHEGVAQ